MTDFAFDLDASIVCLDFANSYSSSGEHLHTYADLVAFAEQSALVTPAEANWLRAQSLREPVLAQGVLTRALHLRDALRGLFFAVAADDDPPDADLGILN